MNAAGRRFARVAVVALLIAPAVAIIAMGFVAPLVRLAILSVSAPAGPLAAFSELGTVDVYRIVLRNTVILALVVSAASLVIGFVLALALTRLEPGWRAIVFGCVVLPLWISVLVRTFSWMLILESNGPLNRFLMAVGITDKPFPLLFAFPGVAIGMTHVVLPYAVLPIYAAIARIDPLLLRASDGLGASRATLSTRVAAALGARPCDRRRLHLPSVTRLLRDARAAWRAVHHDDSDADQFLRQRAARLAARGGGLDDVARDGPYRGRRRRAFCTRERNLGDRVTQAGAWDQGFRGADRRTDRHSGSRGRAARLQRAELRAPAATELVVALVGHILRRSVLAARAPHQPGSCDPVLPSLGRGGNFRRARAAAAGPSPERSPTVFFSAPWLRPSSYWLSAFTRSPARSGSWGV